MAGVVLFICIPTSDHEENLKLKPKKSVKIEEKDAVKKAKCDETVPLNLEPKNCNYNATAGSESSMLSVENPTMEMLTLELLKTLKIENYSWVNKDGKYVQIMFPLQCGTRCEEILEIFKENIISRCKSSVLSIIPCNLFYQGSPSQENDDEYEAEEDGDAAIDDQDSEQAKKTAWSRFVSSSTRLAVAQVVESLKSEAKITFDFISLVAIATLLCAIGLVEDSNVCLLSSMLISPMMGPVMAGTFGTVIRDKKLFKMGVQSELLGLGLAVVIGFCYGSIICMSTDRYGENDWPTSEMRSRGEIRALGVGCLIALLSGAAIALGILSANFASLVGVAISTSLMPPAVNAGLLWSMTFVYYFKGNETSRYVTLSYTEYYSHNRTIELTSLGAISLSLTFVNIVCIYVAGLLVFKIKEVAPIASRDKERRQFWKHGIKIARDYNKTQHHSCDQGNESVCKIPMSFGVSDNSFHSMCESTGNCPVNNCKNYQFTWSPCMDFKKTVRKYKERAVDSSLKHAKLWSSPSRENLHLGKLAQIFSDNYKARSSNDILSVMPGAQSAVRKFTVTPTSMDPLKLCEK